MTANSQPGPQISPQFGLIYDFRNPPQWRRPWAEFYNEMLDEVQLAERLGYDHVWITEHHFIEDGYTPSVLPIAAAVARLTSRVRIGTWVLLLPLHNAIRVAEDAATVDILSNGRLDLGVGLGYRIEEFEGFGVDRRKRGRIMDESLEILSRTLNGETVSLEGEHYRVKNVTVTPPPVQRPFPLWVGARSVPAARRAARFRANLMIVADRPVYEAWAEQLAAQGDDPADFEVLLSAGGFVTDDPDALWERLRPHQRYLRDTYGKWYSEAADLGEDDPLGRMLGQTDEDLRERFVAGPPDQVAEAIARTLEWIPAQHVISMAAPPGAEREFARASMERFANEVIPLFR